MASVRAIGGRFDFEVKDQDFIEKEYSSGGASFMYSLYFLDETDKKMKGILSENANKYNAGNYTFVLPTGTLIPKGAKAIGMFVELPTAEGVDFGKVDLRDFIGNDFSVIPVTLDGTYSHSTNFLDGITNLADTTIQSDGIESARVKMFSGSSLKYFKDQDPRPGYISGKIDVSMTTFAEQGTVTLYFYDRFGARIAKIGQLNYSGHRERSEEFFTIPTGTKIPGNALYIGQSFPTEKEKQYDLAAFLIDNCLQNKVTFTDVDSSIEVGSLYNMITKGILTGFDDGTLRPKETVTRKQFAAIVSRAFKLPAEIYANTFKDVKRDDWFAGVVAAAVQSGLLQGYEDGTFRPDETLTHKEMYAIMFRALTWREEKKVEYSASYLDMTVSDYKGGSQFPDWLKPAVSKLFSAQDDFQIR